MVDYEPPEPDESDKSTPEASLEEKISYLESTANYVPELIAEEMKLDVQKVKDKLLLRTRAKYEPKVEEMVDKKYEIKSSVTCESMPNKAGVNDNHFSRTKLAFLDTSSAETKRG